MARLFESLRVFAKRDDEIVHQEAVGAGDLVVGAYGLGKSAQDEKPVGGKFAGIFGRRIVARRQSVGERFYEACHRLCLEPAQGFLFAGRDEAGNRNHALPGFSYDFINGGGVFFGGLFAREAHREKKGRGEERQIADGIPDATGRENRVADVCASQKSIGIARFPKRAGGIELDVAPECLELARGEGEHEPEFLFPRRRGCRPEPCIIGSNPLEFVDSAYDIEIWGFAVIHDQKQMHMIRHDDEIGGRHGRVSRMGCAPRFGNRLTRLRQRDRGIVVDAREYLPPPFRAESEKEEFQASPMEIQSHGGIISRMEEMK